MRAGVLSGVNDTPAGRVLAPVPVLPGVFDVTTLIVPPHSDQSVALHRSHHARFFKDFGPDGVANAPLARAVVCPKARQTLANPRASAGAPAILQ